jgi:hypothetical protein
VARPKVNFRIFYSADKHRGVKVKKKEESRCEAKRDQRVRKILADEQASLVFNSGACNRNRRKFHSKVSKISK